MSPGRVMVACDEERQEIVEFSYNGCFRAVVKIGCNQNTADLRMKTLKDQML